MTALIQEIQSRLVNLVGQAIELLPALLVAAVVLLLTRYVSRLVQRLVSATARRVLKSRSLQSLTVQTSFVATWVAGILAAGVIAFPGLRVGDLIALLGLSSVAVGFAFQDIFKNFLAGILLLLHEPFQLHDQIVVDDYEGTVEEIAIRSTQIRTYRGERVVIPNSLVFTSPVQVLTALSHRRTDLSIGVDYNTPLPKAREVFYEALQGVEGVLAEPEIEVDVVSFGDSSIDLVVRYWTYPERATVRRTQTQVVMALKAACDRADISIPYPIRTVYHFDQREFADFMPLSADRNGN
ncbi:Putative transport system permease protein [Geitlerinema sp. FC II]|uniref:mechanosensitive ion channel family protein n=1 Tax=Baaleninema simplex TaxID=2862350 RepID=UPI0003480175|nr:mechanosensitive ion channel family protein [Baaleninema simplex]MDC0832415.1 mechanosensitive ion channel family protein [Geitlerinema sp. CS-897]PPT07479.1 Putative transport system permease protein [Geitlerinema sp. FC II]